MQLFHLTVENMAAQRNPDGVASFEKLVELSCVCQEAVIAFDNVDDMIIDHPHLLKLRKATLKPCRHRPAAESRGQPCSKKVDAQTILTAVSDIKRIIRYLETETFSVAAAISG